MAKRLCTFRINEHLGKNGNVVEVFSGDEFIASIYPTEGGVKIVSKHLQPEPEDAVTTDSSYPPAISIQILR